LDAHQQQHNNTLNKHATAPAQGCVWDGQMQLGSLRVSAFTARIDGIPVLLLRPDWGACNLFKGGRIYGGSYNELEAYLAFSRACLEYLRVSGRQPEVIHAHEWQLSAVPMLYWCGVFFYEIGAAACDCIMTVAAAWGLKQGGIPCKPGAAARGADHPQHGQFRGVPPGGVRLLRPARRGLCHRGQGVG
jgi:hypothetical protein